MAGTILKVKQSAVIGKIPTAQSLVQGELALNTTDKKLYSKDARGVVFELGAFGLDGGSSNNSLDESLGATLTFDLGIG